jgi:argininosuccinate lyase
MQTEVAEVAEPYETGRGGSSTMPQKRNPISSNYIHACVSMVRQNVTALLDAGDYAAAAIPLERARRYRRDLSVVFCDVDRFGALSAPRGPGRPVEPVLC